MVTREEYASMATLGTSDSEFKITIDGMQVNGGVLTAARRHPNRPSYRPEKGD
jgi:hypothetical protein